MSRSWSSAHDWKSCRGQKLLESSNLSIREFESLHLRHVAADDISFAATFCKSHFSLILSQLLSESNPLTLGFDSVFYYSTGYLFTNISHAGAKSALLRRIFISTIKNTSCVAPLLLLSETHPSDVSRGPFQTSYRLRRRFSFSAGAQPRGARKGRGRLVSVPAVIMPSLEKGVLALGGVIGVAQAEVGV